MYPDAYLWWEALERQQTVRSEIARERLAGAVPRLRHPALRAGLARGLRELANRLDGQVYPGQQLTGACEARGPRGQFLVFSSSSKVSRLRKLPSQN